MKLIGDSGSALGRSLLVLFLAFSIPHFPISSAQEDARLPKPSEVVKARAYVSLEPVPRGAEFEVAVVGEILPAFHVNANKVLEDYLIPTTLKQTLPAGVSTVQASYPQGLLKKFPFAKEKMSVYEKQFTVRVKLRAAADAPLGAMKIPMTLRYQACNNTTCLPPVDAAVAAALTVAEATAKPRPAYPEVFSKKM